jgi:hypothetical protein
LLIVFSNALTPVRAAEFLNEGQLVWTVKVVEAVSPLVCPLACTGCAPGCAGFGTVRMSVKFPAPSAFVVFKVAASNVTLIVSPEEYPEPVAVVLLVGGPEFGESEIDAVTAKLVPAEITPHEVTRTPRNKTLPETDRSAEIMTPPYGCAGSQPAFYSRAPRGCCLRIVKENA